MDVLCKRVKHLEQARQHNLSHALFLSRTSVGAFAPLNQRDSLSPPLSFGDVDVDGNSKALRKTMNASRGKQSKYNNSILRTGRDRRACSLRLWKAINSLRDALTDAQAEATAATLKGWEMTICQLPTFEDGRCSTDI